MDLKDLKDARREPLCAVCGQPEDRHLDLGMLHEFTPASQNPGPLPPGTGDPVPPQPEKP